jgi:hypothetical protein
VTINLTTGQRILIAVVGVVVLVLALSLGVKKGVDQTAVIPASVAMDRALAIANEPGPSGGSLTPPTEARGQISTYGQAYQFIFNQPLDPQDSAALGAAYPVWLVVLQGQFVEHVPASADGSIPAKDVLHSQMAIILDGDTTQSLARVMISPTQPLDVSSLPVLPLPTGAPAATTTPAPTSIFAPAPTQNP